MSILELKKILQKKGFKISRLKNNQFDKYFKSFYLTTLSSFILIIVLASLPLLDTAIDETFSKSKITENLSKKYLEKALSGETLVTENNIDDDYRNLYEDVEFKDGPSKSVRIEASILNEIFKDKNYFLKNVRNQKIVKPFEVGMLPEEMRNIENSKERKDLFIKIVLPLILSENNIIKRDRIMLFKILNKNNNSKIEKEWLQSKFKQYGVKKRDLSTLKVRMDEIPVSLAIAQAAKETGWGTSRFAIEGNALFGQWTYTGEGIKPAASDKEDKHKVMAFSVLKASVRAYQRNLNTHSSYKNFRQLRAQLRDDSASLDSLLLADQLDNYAETGKEYTKILKQIINQNSLKDFDDVKLMPLSVKYKNLI